MSYAAMNFHLDRDGCSQSLFALCKQPTYPLFAVKTSAATSFGPRTTEHLVFFMFSCAMCEHQRDFLRRAYLAHYHVLSSGPS